MFKKKRHPFNLYVDGVLSGKVPAGKLVRWACERHLRDLKRGEFYFDEQSATDWIDFFGHLRHWKGPLAGQAITLAPWQQFIIASLFGWKQENGLRRFREAYEQIARKNGKTTITGGIGLGGMVIDGEAGAQIVSAATKKDQARLMWSDAMRMGKKCPELLERMEFLANAICDPVTESKFEPLGADADSLDGLDIHMGLLDEVHAHKSRAVYDVIDTATSNRLQPLMFSISTAGFNKLSFCKISLRDYGERVLDPASDVKNEKIFFYIAELDEGDEWLDETKWPKANPNLGVSVRLEDLRAKAAKAIDDPTAENNFRCKHLDQWVSQDVRWMPMHVWDQNTELVNEEHLHGRHCYGALDLSSTIDLSAWALVFPMGDGSFSVLLRAFMPEERLKERMAADQVPYDLWARQGHIILTPGDTIDHRSIMHYIDQDAHAFNVREVAFDRWGATEMMQRLSEGGLTVIQYPQTFSSFSPPTKALYDLTHAQRLRHGRNPVLRWMADNVVVEKDAVGNIRPSKNKSTQKIDGIVAMIMALDRALKNPDGAGSIYETRGVVTV